MFFNKTTTYALRIMVFMTMHDEEYTSAQQIHETLDIPKKYLMRLLTTLTKHNFIKSTKGRNGGYSFNKKLDKIFLSEIVDSIEGLDLLEKCTLGVKDCKLDNTCVLQKVLCETRQKMLQKLLTTNLNDLKKINKKILNNQSLSNNLKK